MSTPDEVLQLFISSIGQGLNINWIDARKSRANGSTFHKIIQAVLKNNLSAFKKTLWSYWKPKPPQCSAVDYGDKKEAVAIKKFEEVNKDLTIVPAGECKSVFSYYGIHILARNDIEWFMQIYKDIFDFCIVIVIRIQNSDA